MWGVPDMESQRGSVKEELEEDEQET